MCIKLKLYFPGFCQRDSKLIHSFMKAEFHILLCSPVGRKRGLSLPANRGTAGASELLLLKVLVAKISARNWSNLVADNFLLIILGKFSHEPHSRLCKQHARRIMKSRLIIWQICTDTSPTPILLTYLLNYLLTYLLTYLLHGAESFLRS